MFLKAIAKIVAGRYTSSMENYELTVVLDEKATAAKKKKVEEVVEKMITLLKGKLGKVADWGVIGSWSYLFFPLELEKSSVKMIATKLSQEEDIKKHLLIRKD